MVRAPWVMWALPYLMFMMFRLHLILYMQQIRGMNEVLRFNVIWIG